MTLEAAASPRVSRVTRVNDVSKSRRVRLPSKYSIDARPSGPVRTVSPSRSDVPSSPVSKAPLPRWTATCPARRRSVANCLAEAVPPEKIRTAPTNSSASTKTAVIEISRPRLVFSDNAQGPPAGEPILVAPSPHGKHVGRISASIGRTKTKDLVRRSEALVCLLRVIPRLGPAAELGLDQLLEIAIQDPIDVADLDVGPVVLHEPVRRQDVGADLRAEVDPLAFAPEVLELGLLLLPHALGQTGLEDPHRHRPVLQLRALVLTRRRDPARQVRDPHRGVRGVDGLPARARRAVHVDPQVLGVD